MKKEVTTGQLLAIAFSFVMTVGAGWITFNNKLTAQEERIKSLENAQSKWDRVVDRIEAKIDENNKLTNQVLVQLQNKKDR